MCLASPTQSFSLWNLISMPLDCVYETLTSWDSSYPEFASCSWVGLHLSNLGKLNHDMSSSLCFFLSAQEFPTWWLMIPDALGRKGCFSLPWSPLYLLLDVVNLRSQPLDHAVDLRDLLLGVAQVIPVSARRHPQLLVLWTRGRQGGCPWASQDTNQGFHNRI